MADNQRSQKGPRVPTVNSLRNLPQYKHLDEDALKDKVSQLVLGIEYNKISEERINAKLKEFEDSYDLSEMMPNDKIVLKSMVQAMVRLDDYEAILSNLEVNESNLLIVRELSKLCEGLRDSISKAQNDLKITRRIRKSEKEETVLNFLEDLKAKAKKFYYKKHLIILCPKCNVQLFSGRFLYPDYKTNKLSLYCHRKLTDGSVCDGHVEINSKELLEMGGCNRPEMLPESIR